MAMTVQQVIEKLEAGDMTGLTKAQVQEAMKARTSGTIGATVKINPLSGVISVYGIGRNPAPYYASQWRTILGAAKAIEAACDNPMASTGKDDARYAFYRGADAHRRKAMTDQYRAANSERQKELLAAWRAGKEVTSGQDVY